ncbi:MULTISPECIES: mechanosensitive ion channel family protein [Halobacteriovorax]|uniref:Mechanosensitive ion channel n=1 Tax=Halobacteriovorax vibrionivorans TaxID=2152716 RepID=A0ABY0IFV9_9BACT|nr:MULTISPECIES: mechanosensitive ion channel domain-containing protein [Halobacteriovorax]AYF43585.1 transporter, small conductance mechanosensitive ion channel MscS family protein [Halobacteriovorax sp. BALOs_7]RZF21846.1 mechanosensitive ion channel [Halobacteriovorax vibrionivorans]TGD48320.1 mechanosensitive ion channel [Halobacteriovorax sp. Y22]
MNELLNEANIEKVTKLMAEYGFILVKVIIVLVVGLKLISYIEKFFQKVLTKKKVDVSIRKFIVTIISITLKVGLLISVVGMVGIKTTSFVALLGAAGLAVGMSLKDALGNLAGGVLILFFKPFRVGDFIEGQGYSGKVREIGLFCTSLNTPDNKRVILPNGGLSSGSIVNYSAEDVRRVDLVFGIGYDDDIKKAKEILNKLVNDHPLTLDDPAPVVAVLALADSSINFAVRPWVKSADYWTVHFELHEQVKLTFDSEGISIPFPQRDVHLYQESK